ncbi:hypothetical protein [Pseudomonas syringae group genomosp. 3]|uniref:Mg chelatase-like protein n=1 Tax=Pseudomonas syringae pv. maculicola TaxID=59511 RepID=A0A3M2Z414_PSEYM|nr:hypothetical protein [Pseudomonas syringae group genomosp. 3]KPB90320.1 Mg chelatase-like protein [Pseudomonas syringae pv. maculicola]KPY88967.1 Mg chelatase-like protein [Pseudomonas syringae pv. tomato]RML82665.1 Mg chelatase-like protein [Pseudomonas syringae pv. maculicola]
MTKKYRKFDSAFKLDAWYPRHKPHLAKNEGLVYRGISGEQFHDKNAS